MSETTNNKEQTKKEKIFVTFSNKQIYNTRTIKDLAGKELKLSSVSFPKSSKYAQYHIDVPARFIFSSKYSDKLSYVSFLPTQEVSIYRYDKETKTQDVKKITSEEVQAEFLSWKTKSINEKTNDNKTDEKATNEEYDDLEM